MRESSVDLKKKKKEKHTAKNGGCLTWNPSKTLNWCRFLSLSKSSKGIRHLSCFHSICLTQLASSGRWAEMGSKWRTSVDTQRGGEGEVWHVLWQLLHTLMHTHTHTHIWCSSHLSTSIERQVQPPPPPPTTTLSFPPLLYFSCQNSSCSPDVPWGLLLWGDPDKIGDADGTANQKLKMLSEQAPWMWANQWAAQHSSMQSETGLC